MMPVIRVSDPTFADLSTLKTWFGTKTPGDTIERLVREAMEQLGMEREEEPEAVIPTLTEGPFVFDAAPSLAFTKPLSASVNGKAINSPRWSAILLATIAQLKAKGFEAETLVRELQVPAKLGQHEQDGFKYHVDLGISVQGQSAPDAWKEIDRIAKKWGIPVTVEFQWRQNTKAQYPGKTGIVRSGKS